MNVKCGGNSVWHRRFLLFHTLLPCRLANADQALENLHFYQSAYRSEEPCIAALEQQASKLPPFVSTAVEDAQKEVEIAMVCPKTKLCLFVSSVCGVNLENQVCASMSMAKAMSPKFS